MNNNNTKKPNFFIIGSPRSGTTSLSIYLKNHPNIFFSTPKEPNYFCFDIPDELRKTKTLQEYLNLFKNVDINKNKAIGEGSVSYLSSIEAIPKIVNFNSNSKFIVMLRNPIDIAHSKFYLEKFFRNENQKSFQKAWNLQKDRKQGKNIPKNCTSVQRILYGESSKLGNQVERLYRFVNKENVKIIIFDDFVQNIADIYRDVLSFLDVPSDNRKEFPKYNARYSYKSTWISLLSLFLYKLGIRKHYVFKWNKQKVSKVPLDKDFRNDLKNYFREDVEKLSKIINRDLTHWVY